MSIFLQKPTQSAAQAWTWTWTPGANLANFFALYDSRGDVTISAPTSIATTLDGPIQVARYGALVVNAALTASQRCRGLMPIADTLSMGAAGSISMTGKGAKGASNWAVDRNIFVPQSITFTGKNTSLAQFLAWIRSTGYCIFDPTLWSCPLPGMGDVTSDWATWTPHGSSLIVAADCGAALAFAAIQANTAGANGNAGATGSGARGGIAAPGSHWHFVGKTGPGRPWGGGAAQGGGYSVTNSAHFPDRAQFGDAGSDGQSASFACGGGAGIPGGAGINSGVNGGNGVGGVLFVIVSGDVSVSAGHDLSASGMPGGNASAGSPGGAGGGSGGGHVSLLRNGALTGTPNIVASGGAGGTGAQNGGAGGIGSTRNTTFDLMGW